MSTQLSVFNGALRLLGEASIDDVDDTNKPAPALRDAWEDVVRYALEVHNWNFASKRAELQRITATPAHSYDYYYAKPSDWQRTISIRDIADDHGETIIYSVDEGGGDEYPKGLIATSVSSIFMRYISSDYMTKVGNWPETFARFVSSLLAEETCSEITGNNSKMDYIEGKIRRRKHDAINWDAAMNQPRFTRPGRLVLSRYGASTRTQGGAQD